MLPLAFENFGDQTLTVGHPRHRSRAVAPGEPVHALALAAAEASSESRAIVRTAPCFEVRHAELRPYKPVHSNKVRAVRAYYGEDCRPRVGDVPLIVLAAVRIRVFPYIRVDIPALARLANLYRHGRLCRIGRKVKKFPLLDTHRRKHSLTHFQRQIRDGAIIARPAPLALTRLRFDTYPVWKRTITRTCCENGTHYHQYPYCYHPPPSTPHHRYLYYTKSSSPQPITMSGGPGSACDNRNLPTFTNLMFAHSLAASIPIRRHSLDTSLS
mmetsp:Transcript_24034/g.67303  ORF Transcript_24034/g.67303 Transcript_24034/m.67303 type:complete len:270 (-) Transcript_24034:859-1668(-)